MNFVHFDKGRVFSGWRTGYFCFAIQRWIMHSLSPSRADASMLLDNFVNVTWYALPQWNTWKGELWRLLYNNIIYQSSKFFFLCVSWSLVPFYMFHWWRAYYVSWGNWIVSLGLASTHGGDNAFQVICWWIETFTCAASRFNFTIGRLDKLVALHCKRRTWTRTSSDGCLKLLSISDNVSVVIQDVLVQHSRLF